jgi:hypothetical protein
MAGEPTRASLITAMTHQATLWRRGEKYSFTWADALWLLGEIGQLERVLTEEHEQHVRDFPTHRALVDPTCEICQLLDPNTPWSSQ